MNDFINGRAPEGFFSVRLFKELVPKSSFEMISFIFQGHEESSFG